MSAFQLAWNEFNSATSSTFQDLYTDQEFTDVTLATEDDKQLKAHKVILSSCSSFFRKILLNNPHQHPLLYLKGVKFAQLKSVIQFMYLGQAEVAQEDLQSFMNSAQDLGIKGLTEIASSVDAKPEMPSQETVGRNEIVQENYEHSDTNDQTNELDLTEDSHYQTKGFETLTNETFGQEYGNDEVFRCSQCNYQTRNKSHLRRHINSIHEGQKYPCDQCNYQASQDSNLKRHKRSAHPHL